MRKGNLALLVFLTAACDAPSAPSTTAASSETSAAEASAQVVTRDARTSSQSVVYGADDRLDFYEHPDAALRALTEQSIAAMVSNRAIEIDGDDVSLRASSLGDDYSLCEGELFFDQPSLAGCSGTLIDDNLILTAGHCVENGCENSSWVFNYLYEDEDSLRDVVAADVFSCERVVVESTPSFRDSVPDYAIVQLDRAATPRFVPATVNPEEWPVSQGDPVTIIGFGSGIPAKIDNGGFVTNERRSERDYFQATTDAFGGNSGSGVFNADNAVVGILVAGEQDYDYSRGCGQVAVLPEDGVDGESVTYAILAVDELCESGWPSVRLCNTVTECGNGFCELGETEETCAADCEEAGGGEWTCDPSFFSAGDGCDCDCGVFDPDCTDASQETFNCRAGEFCNGAGVCEGEAAQPVPAEWLCDAATFNAQDGCDCECGAFDPDCDIPSSIVYNCVEGDTCSDEGICSGSEPQADDTTIDAGAADVGAGADVGVDTSTDVGTGDGFVGSLSGCSATGGRNAAAWWLLAAGAAVMGRTRRRR